MHRFSTTIKWITLVILMLGARISLADEILVAVASNFSSTIREIAERFEASTGHKVKLTFGSTGKHYAQIIHGAPYDLFFAADSRRPERLEQNGNALPQSRFTYAIGRLALWSPLSGYVDSEGRVLEQNEFHHIAIANPKLAPYGKAAQEIMQQRGVWRVLRGKAVRGENIGQTFQFVKSGNAELGFVAYSQIKRPAQSITGSFWEVPQTLYTPIRQQAVVLKEGEAALAFAAFVKSPESLEIIRSFGYGTP
ncbi:MAG: molybdate ABC transporter substrate-binding protein [Gammaproteobacteria bacterium]|nr:molybdate ABC transporter substrate-binding protein [Gammaproteobacteria bacterium]